MDEGTDTGPIILQKAVEVQPDDTPEVAAAPRDGTGRVEDPAEGHRHDRERRRYRMKTDLAERRIRRY
ncbi:MAG: hypothetical protein ACLR8P_03500 [Clostridium fessum]